MKINKTINIKNVLIIFFYLVLLIPFFEIPYFTEYLNKFNTIYDLLLVFSSSIILLLTIKKKHISKINIYIIILMLILLFSSIFNGTNIMFCIKDIVKTLGLCLLVEYGIKYDKNNFVKSFSIFLSLLVYINLFSIFKDPNGLYMNKTGYIENWFLGYKNTHILYIMPALLFNIMNSYLKKGKMTFYNYFFLIISLISTILVNNGTGIVGLMIIIIFILFTKFINKFSVINIKNGVYTYLTLFICIVILRLQNLFKFLIVDILHKDLTFTGRIYVWDKALKMIKNKPLLGYGNVSFEYSRVVYSTHNTILGIMHKTGLLGLIMYFVIIFGTEKELYITRKNYISKFVSSVVFSYLIMMLTEAYAFKYFLFILVLGFNIKHLIVGSDNDEKNNACQ